MSILTTKPNLHPAYTDNKDRLEAEEDSCAKEQNINYVSRRGFSMFSSIVGCFAIVYSL